MSNIEIEKTVGIIGTKQKVVGLFSRSIEEKGLSFQAFNNTGELSEHLIYDSPPDIIIVSEKTTLDSDAIKIPRVVIGLGEKGAAEKALNEGAWDYISTKGESMAGVADYTAAKVDRLLKSTRKRVNEIPPTPPFGIEGILVDINKNQIILDGNPPIHARPKLIDLLAYFVTHPDQELSRKTLYEVVDVAEYNNPESIIKVYLSSIKKLLGDRKDHLQTQKGRIIKFLSNPPNDTNTTSFPEL